MSEISKAMETLSRAMQNDSNYARGWHDNLAIQMQDEGVDRDTANRAAARFMKLAFEVNTEKEE